MQSQEYRAAVLSTESKPETLNAGDPVICNSITLMMLTAQFADALKKVIFYGKTPDIEKLKETLEAIASNAVFMGEITLAEGHDFNLRDTDEPTFFSQDNIDKRLLHAALGTFSEAGELLEACFKAGIGEPVDRANVIEEIGDMHWYLEVAADAMGVGTDAVRDVNIKKLAARYPQGFSVASAENRDLAAERAILEAGVTRPM